MTRTVQTILTNPVNLLPVDIRLKSEARTKRKSQKRNPKQKANPPQKKHSKRKKEEPKEKTKPQKKPSKEKANAETKETEPKKKAEKRKVIAFIYSLFWHEFLMIAGIIIFALCIRTCITDSKIVIFDFDIPFRFSNFFSSKPLSNIEESFNITLRKFYFMNMRYNFTASRNFSSSIVMYPCKLPVVIVDFRQAETTRLHSLESFQIHTLISSLGPKCN